MARRHKATPHADVGIFGGSGLYSLFAKMQKITLDTPFGPPSAPVMLGTHRGVSIAFLPRHGGKHEFPPHKIPYQANLWAFKKLGVKRIIAPCAAGSLAPKIKPGEFVICDQFVDRTHSRPDTFFAGPRVAHISMADPYCPELRNLAIQCCVKLKIPYHKEGTIVVIQGPRFSSRAESKWYQNNHWDVINMTSYPEMVLARELKMCYVNIALITDYDTGLEGYQEIKPVTAEEVVRIFKANERKVKKLICEMLGTLPEKRQCRCQRFLREAFI